RVGVHAALNSCEEICERVALERQLDDDQRLLLVKRSQAVIQQGREILYAWDAAWNDAQALDNSLLQERAGRFADALEKYAAGLAAAASTPPVIELIDTAISPTLYQQEQRVMQQMARLPDWTRPALTPAEEQVQGAAQL
ncbi:MAG: multidrug transporter subunit MdtO, partial [Klebsiella sp.]|nr:multidrug transporter subunit MdtO [Klebsiella sp.]